MEDDIKTRFLRDVRNHKLTIENDNGVHRCIHLGNPGTSSYHFRLITWPGGLSITGDMGDYSFSRTRDMFEFFRDGEMTNQINAQYWHEKMQSEDKQSKAKEFSQRKFKSAVRENMGEWEVILKDADMIKREVEDQVLEYGVSCLDEAYSVISDFRSSEGHEFEEFHGNLHEWSFHFKWALHAIVWGIKQYDLVKEKRTQADWDLKILSGII